MNNIGINDHHRHFYHYFFNDLSLARFKFNKYPDSRIQKKPQSTTRDLNIKKKKLWFNSFNAIMNILCYCCYISFFISFFFVVFFIKYAEFIFNFYLLCNLILFRVFVFSIIRFGEIKKKKPFGMVSTYHKHSAKKSRYGTLKMTTRFNNDLRNYLNAGGICNKFAVKYMLCV